LRLIRRRPFYVVQNGVDLERIGRVLAAAPVSAAPAGNGFVVGSVGRLIDRKDPIALLHAFTMAAGEDDRLVYVGDGPDRAGLLEEARRANAESRVVVTGLLARDEVYRHLLGMDLVVSASHAEGLPVAVLEAMACSRPVVISDIPSHREIADQTKFIPLVSPGDLAGLSWEIARFRAMKPRERRQIGARCRQLVEARFSLDAMDRSYLSVYESVLGRTNGVREQPHLVPGGCA
jgi:glycosyltransferase involved in cell wall biosynthesis